MPRPRRRRPVVTSLLLAAGLALAGCGTGDEEADAGPDEADRAADAETDADTPDDADTDGDEEPATTDPSTEPSGGATTTASGDEAADNSGDGGRAASEPYSGALVPEIVATYPHDTGAFTQGLEWYGDRLLESTGLLEESSLRLVDPVTGQAEVVVDVADELFAEGVTVVDGEALQLTWQNETLLVSDLDRLGVDGSTSRSDGAYDGEGWGLCYDGSSLAMSDGTSQLEFRDPVTFEVERSVAVTLDGAPVDQLNELECVGDQVWANVWLTNRIVAIDAATGEVEATVDASSLEPAGVTAGNDVLNGIAYHHDTGRFWLTGKRWPVLYEVNLVPADG